MSGSHDVERAFNLVQRSKSVLLLIGEDVIQHTAIWQHREVGITHAGRRD